MTPALLLHSRQNANSLLPISRDVGLSGDFVSEAHEVAGGLEYKPFLLPHHNLACSSGVRAAGGGEEIYDETPALVCHSQIDQCRRSFLGVGDTTDSAAVTCEDRATPNEIIQVLLLFGGRIFG